MAATYRFDDILVDLRNFRATKSGKALPFEPKTLNVLVFLIEQRGRLVEKQEILDAIWGDSFVTENVLTRAVAQLRKGLADDPKTSRYIETVPTRGYRFIAAVLAEENGDSELRQSAPFGVAQGSATPAMTHARNVSNSSASAAASYALPAPTIAGTISGTNQRHGWKVGLALLFSVALIVAALWIARTYSAGQPLQIARNAQITATDGLSIYPTLSPSGDSIAYSSDRGKGFEIFVRQLQTDGQEVQITADGEENLEPAWSPDGKMIAYHSLRRGGIWLIPALGGTTRQLTTFGSRPAWSPDNQRIAFQSSALNDVSADSVGSVPPSNIWVVQADGNSEKQITQPGKPNGGHGNPSWSPDGKHVVFVSMLHGPTTMWATGADGTGLVQLAPMAYHYDPVYLPDGRAVLYGAVTAGENYGLWELPVSPKTSVPTGPPIQITNSGGTRFKNLSISADGKRLVYAAVTLTGSLQSLPISKSGDPAGEPVALTSNSGCRDILPAISHDGLHIAYNSCRGRAGIPQQTWVMNAEGGNRQQLTFGKKASAFPTWFPDNRRVLFESSGSIFDVDIETRQQKLLHRVKQDTGEVSLSPDGTHLLMNSIEAGVINLWSMDMSTGGLKQLTFDKEMCGFGQWSPDGKYIAAELGRGENTSIVVFPSQGGPMTELVPARGQNWLRSWSPDGDKVIFAKQQDDAVWNVWSVSRSTKAQKQLTHYATLNGYVRYPATSPRGDQIVYEYTQTNGNIWTVEFK